MMKARRILLAEDEVALRDFVSRNLRARGFEVLEASNGLEAMAVWEREDPHLLILDIMMPRMDGLAVCQRVREHSAVPIIVLTALDAESDKVTALDLGADDYLTKPFGFVELQARIRAMLRRATMPSVDQKARQTTRFNTGGLVVDIPSHHVTLHGKPVSLTPTEFRLLEHLLKHSGMVLTHSQLLTAAWGFAYSDATELLKPAISRLRQKVEEDPSHPTLIQTVHGVGYRLVLAQAT